MHHHFNDPNLQQGMQFNRNFNTQNSQLANLNVTNLNNFHGLNPNLQPMPQNNQLGVIQLLAAQLQRNPQLQINLLNQLQAQNLAAPFQQGGLHFMGHNPNQMIGMPNARFFGQGQMFQGNQMMGLSGNPGLCPNGMSSGFGNAPCSMGQNPVFGNPAACSVKTQWNKKNMQQANRNQQFQVNHIEAKITDNSHVNSQNSASRGPARNFHGSGKEPSHNRFQKSQLHGTRSSKGNMRQFNRRGGRGQHNWREQKSQSTNSGEEAPTVRRRPLPLNYTKTEIQLWREARRKNFPTRANINKKAGGSENDEDAVAKLRRQQLKEVLAKQAELGVEVAEIPPSYLCEPENLVPEKENEREATDGRSANRFNKRRGRGNGRDNWRSKRQKFQNQRTAPTSPPSVKREPSLLEKLLSADIKRDKSRLLQVFRFMVLNDFFTRWPDKPLEFPIVTVKDDGVLGKIDPSLDCAGSPSDDADKKAMAEGIGNQKESSVAEEMENVSDEEDTIGIDNIMEEDGIGEQFEESEEGEITD